VKPKIENIVALNSEDSPQNRQADYPWFYSYFCRNKSPVVVLDNKSALFAQSVVWSAEKNAMPSLPVSPGKENLALFIFPSHKINVINL
jgi:hypothetical protein